MNPYRRSSRWWVSALVGVFIILIGLGMLVFHDWDQTHATPVPQARSGGVRLVCAGHIDVEGGVVALHPGQSGRVMKVLVRETQRVEAGAALLLLDDARPRLQVRQLEEELKSAEARLAQARRLPRQHEADLALQRSAIAVAEARLAAARQLLQRQQNLHKISQISDEEVQAAADRVDEADAGVRAEKERLAKLRLSDVAEQIAQAEAEVAARQARLEEARHALAECTLQAPTAGEVLRVLTAPGDLLMPAQHQAAILFCPDQPRIVRAEVPQEFAAQVKVGQSASIQDDARPGTAWTGQVLRISNWFTRRRSVLEEPQQRHDERTLECILSLDAGGPPARIGQRVKVTIADER